ncbi:hypothetical protein GQ600_16119 [Phytophthora cactorum]|nr:hypothetical protein GQ600_16119 [Phytophthora cactorum]
MPRLDSWIVERIVGYEPRRRTEIRLVFVFVGEDFLPTEIHGNLGTSDEDVPEMVRAYEAQNGVQA